MKSRITHPLTQMVLTSIALVAISIACSASRSATSPELPTNDVATNPSATASSSAQEKTPCSLDVSHVPAIKGLKLGMTRDEVLAAFPGSKDDPELRPMLAVPPGPLGTSSFLIKPSKYENREFADVVQITFNFLDGRVSKIHVGFNGPEWSHVDKFVEKLVEGTTLPAVDQWSPYVGLDNQLKMLSCVNFEVRVFSGGKGGNLNYVQVQDLEADRKLTERRKKAREQASPSPGQ